MTSQRTALAENSVYSIENDFSFSIRSALSTDLDESDFKSCDSHHTNDVSSSVDQSRKGQAVVLNGGGDLSQSLEVEDDMTKTLRNWVGFWYLLLLFTS